MPPQYIIIFLKLSKPLLALENFVSNIEKYCFSDLLLKNLCNFKFVINLFSKALFLSLVILEIYFLSILLIISFVEVQTKAYRSQNYEILAIISLVHKQLFALFHRNEPLDSQLMGSLFLEGAIQNYNQ